MCVCETNLSIVSHFSGFSPLEQMVILNNIIFWSKLNVHQIIYLLEWHIWGKQSIFRNSFSWARGCWGVYRRLVRKGRWKKSKESHSHCHRCWLSWLQLAIGAHVASALDGETKCWFESQTPSPSSCLIRTEFNQLRWVCIFVLLK